MPIDAQHLEAYLRSHLFPDAIVRSIRELGGAQRDALKSHGYGRPIRVTFTSGGQQRDVVLRTMAPDPFGHERRADRAGVLIQAFDSFDRLPRHVRALDCGAFTPEGLPVTLPRGEPFLLTTYAEGELYARDLQSIAPLEAARDLDRARAVALAGYLADLHAASAEPALYVRALRDTIGSGEGLFGLIDAYAADDRVATPARLERIEAEAVRWRWKLKARAARACTTHGDFHPFNLLFREGADFSVLDASRGGVGDAADDLAALSINYLFFALVARERFDGALREVWQAFWETYLQRSGDDEIREVIAPFFTWRALVLANPVWYPAVTPGVRDRVLSFAERLLGGAQFTPQTVDQLLG